MCLITYKAPVRIAKEDMTTFKVLKKHRVEQGKFTSIHDWYFLYELHKIYKTDIGYSDPRNARFPAFKSRKYFSDRYPEEYASDLIRSNSELVAYGPGFHSCKYIEDAIGIYGDNFVMVKCTIPAGSEYHEDPVGGVVSNQIVIDEVIFQFDEYAPTIKEIMNKYKPSIWPEYPFGEEKQYPETLEDLIQDNPQDYTP